VSSFISSAEREKSGEMTAIFIKIPFEG